MSQRDAKLMKHALRVLGKLSPERFVTTHGNVIFYYSARTVRRWMEGHAMPPEVRNSLRAYLTSPTE